MTNYDMLLQINQTAKTNIACLKENRKNVQQKTGLCRW